MEEVEEVHCSSNGGRETRIDKLTKTEDDGWKGQVVDEVPLRAVARSPFSSMGNPIHAIN